MRGLRLYPFLIAVIPVLHMAAANRGWFDLDDLVVVLLVLVTLCGLAYAGAALLVRRRGGAAIAAVIAGLAMVWFWNYADLVDFVGRRSSAVSHLLAFVPALLLSAALVRWLAKRPAMLERGARFVTLAAGLLAGWSAVSIALAMARDARAVARSDVLHRLAAPLPSHGARGPKRDIFLILLDEHANAEVTRERFSFDNRAFVDSLRALGFAVPAVHSNYLHTMLSLPSLLNGAQLDDLAREVDLRTSNPTLPNALVRQNRAAAFLKSQGYRYVLIPSYWWPATRWSPLADIRAELWPSWNFTHELNRTNLRREVRHHSMLDLLHRERDWNVGDGEHVLRSLDAVARVRRGDRPVFVFAHVLSPHKPFTFDRECHSRPARPDYVQQIQCVDGLVLGLVNRLIRESRVPPIILIQADHGSEPGGFDSVDAVTSLPYAMAYERSGALGAYYLPDGGAAELGDTVTIVNVLRTVLRYYFGAELPRVPDDLYLSVVDHPYEFRRVTAASMTRPAALAGESLPRPSADRSR